MSNVFWVILVFMAIAHSSFGKEPSWYNQPALKLKNTLEVSCRGTGPDADVAIRIAMNQCRSIAAEQILSSFEVKTLSVETEGSAGFHSEVESNQSVTGLACKIGQQYLEESDETHTAWVRCQFDTSLTKVVPLIKTKGNSSIQSKNVQMILSSVPMCNSLIVRGSMARVITCHENPQTVMIYPDDVEIVVRSAGYIPKHLKLENYRSISNDTQVVETYLEKQ